MKKIMLFLLSLGLFSAGLSAQDLGKADALFEKNDFAAALPLYQDALKTAAGDTRYTAQLRVAACQYLNGEYNNAAQTIWNYKLPQDPLWKARFLLYRAYLIKSTGNAYGFSFDTTPEREIDSQEAAGDVSQWTQSQRNHQVRQDYQTLWDMRQELINASIENENLILTLKDTDTQRIPTLFDFTLHQILENLSKDTNFLPAKSASLLDGYANINDKEDTLAARATLLKEGAALEGTFRENARIFWQTDFILLPFNYPHQVTFDNKEKALAAAAAQLRALFLPQQTQDLSLWQKTKNRLFPKQETAVDTAYARAYAAGRLAQVFYEQDDYAQSLQTAQLAEKNFPSKLYFVQECKNLAQRIEKQELSFKTQPILNPVGAEVRVTARNAANVFLRIYPVTPEELHAYFKKEYRYWQNDNLQYLRELHQNSARDILAHKTPLHELTETWSYEKPYHAQQRPVTLPALQSGFYVLLGSTDKAFSEQAPLAATILNITDLALVTFAAVQDNPDDYVITLNSRPVTKNPPLYHFFTLNLKTGQPQPNVPLQFLGQKTGSATTDAQGYAARTETFNWSASYTHFDNFSVLAKHNGSTAYTNAPYFYLSPNEPVKVFIQTDRAIYRPAQKVQISVNAFEVLPRGLKVLGNESVFVQVRNTNNETIFKQNLPLNAMGTAQAEMTLPDSNTLLGSFYVSAKVSAGSRSYSASHFFGVEEYKRPEYEVKLDAPKAPLALGKKGTLTGHAQYYTGAPLANAQVKYTLTQKPYLPPFYWWCFYWQPRADKIIAENETTTDAQGNFAVSFTPELADKQDLFVRYTLKADVLDESGRPISDMRNYTIGTQEKLVKATFAQGFYDANTPTPAFVEVDLTDSEGHSAAGTLSVRAVRLENVFSAPKEQGRRNVSLEEYYKDAKEQQVLFTQKIKFAQPGAQRLDLPAAPAGVYRLTLQVEKGTPQHLVFIVADEKAPLTLPEVTLAQHKTYYAGQTARVLTGGENNAPKHLLLFQKEKFLTATDTLPAGAQIYSFPVKPAYRGGIGLGWFSAGDYRITSGNVSLEVPFENKELAVTFTAPEYVKPAQKVIWSLTATDRNKKPVSGQASVDVYDKSLDYYAKKQNPFTAAAFYPQQTAVPAPQMNSGAQNFSFYPHEKYFSGAQQLSLPRLNLRPYFRAYRGGMLKSAGVMMAMASNGVETQSVRSASLEMANDSVAMEENLKADMAVPAMGAITADDNSAQQMPQLRTNFAETAYFNTQVPVQNGKSSFTFTMPDSLTAWNILGFVLTPDVSLGTFSASTISRKDFMVQLVLPRFLREGDKAVLQARVTNLTQKKLFVPVTLDIKDADGTADKRNAFGISNARQIVEVAPQGVAFAQWEVSAPANPALYRLTAAARLGQDSDGEQKELPVLSGRTQLLATQNIALENGKNTLELTELTADKTAQAQTASLTIHPSLALSILNDMPNLLARTNNDLISSLARFTPLAVVHQFYTTYPELKEAVKKLPKRSGVNAAWNQNDPLRLLVLEQTPWLLRSQGKAQHAADIISLFDDKVVSEHLQKELKQIEKYQNPSGAFTWFAGGPDDDYLTLYALESFAQALAYNAQIPQAQVQKAYRYIVPRIEKRLKEDKDSSEISVSFALYAAYVLSSFPKTWPETSAAQTYIKKWVDYAGAHTRFMTALGQTYAAAVYHRLGDDVSAKRYLDLVLSRMKEDPLTGAYFAPEKQSWRWYNDTLATQILTLRTLLEIRPSSDKVDAMTRWLLFNRHANVWENSKTASQAVFTLLDVMKAKGALAAPSSYRVSWAGEVKNFNFEPFDWTEDLQLVKQGAQITPQTYTAQITKQSKMTDFASLSVVYTSSHANASPQGVMNVKREYFLRFMDENGATKLRPLPDNSEVRAGDEIEVHLTLNTRSAFEYVWLNDPKPTGFESETLLSRWTYNPVSMYEEVRDAQTNFFINWLPAGEVKVKYVLRPTTSGKFQVQPAQVQSMYAPEFGAHTASGTFEVKGK